MSDKGNTKLSRRMLVAGAAALAGLAVLPRSRAAAKASKASLQYQDHAKDGKDCDDCLQFIPGKTRKATGQCKVVEGPISPKGWCLAFVQKPGA
jgi:High potential iron-sulfur protein